MNTFGNIFRLTTFGESHGVGLGAIIDNCPPGIELSESDIQAELDRRAPGQSNITTARKEGDKCEILSGVFEGKTTGTPIGVIVRNADHKSRDYSKIKDIFRPSHADFGFFSKYGARDYRGGGRSSGRETVCRVIGGAIAKKILKEKFNTNVWGFTREIGGEHFKNVDKDFIETNILRMADKNKFEETLARVEEIRNEGNSIGGVAEVRIENPQVGLGSPVFGKLEAELARAIMSVGATKFFEIGNGREICAQTGKESNDTFINENGKIHNKKNVNGGILGGISTGDDIYLRTGIKPTSSILMKQTTVNKKGEEVEIEITGRHDPIILPRVIPVLESMAAMVVLDHIMLQKAQNNLFD